MGVEFYAYEGPWIAAEEADFSAYDSVIDVRSPAEYADDHIPGAISAPVLDDERARAGRHPLQAGVGSSTPRSSARRWWRRTSRGHVETLFEDKARDWRPLVYCWRGGKRSGAMAHVLREIGWDATTAARAATRPTGAGWSQQLEALPAAAPIHA